MADLPKTILGAPGKGIVAGGGKPSKKPVEKKGAKGVALRPDYGLIFDPSGWASSAGEIARGEHEALNNLLRQQTGTDVSQHADVQSALDSAGLIYGGGATRGPFANKPTARRKPDDHNVYASATDAFDAIGKGVGAWLGRGVDSAGVKQRLQEVADVTEAAVRPVMEVKTRGGKGTVGGDLAAATEFGVHGVANAISNSPVFNVGMVGVPGSAGYVRKKSGEVVTQGQVETAIQDLASNPNKVIPVGVYHPEGLPSKDPVLAKGLELSANGLSSSELSSVVPAGTFIQPADMLRLSAWAEQNGWPKQEWDSLDLNEKLFRAGNKNNDIALFGRGVVKFLAAQGAVPAGFVGITDASAQALFKGNSADAKKLVAAAIAPYSQYQSVREQRGDWAAFSEFWRDNPGEAALALNAGIKALSKGGAVVGRTGVLGERIAIRSTPGVPIIAKGPTVETAPIVPRIPKPAAWPGPHTPAAAEDLQTLRAGEQLWKDYEASIKHYNDTGELLPVSTDILVGYQDKGLFGNLYLQAIKRRIVEGDVLGLGGRFLRKQAGARPTRLLGNVGQGIKLDIASILERALGEKENAKLFKQRPVDNWTKERAAWDLTRPAETFSGEAYTPAFEAALFRREAAQLRKQIDERVASAEGDKLVRMTVAEEQQLKFWDDYAKFLDRLDQVEIPKPVMDRLREAAKPFGMENDRIVADMLGVSVKEAKQKNYIRVLVADKGIRESAVALKVRQNTRLSVLSKSQQRIQTLSKQIVRHADETGWGAYGPTKSRARYEVTRAALVKELKRAERFARATGEIELADKYAAALAKLDVSKAGGFLEQLAAAKTLVGIEDLSLPESAVRALTSKQQAAYASAKSAAEDVARLEAEQSAALSVAGKKKVSSRDVALAEQRVAKLESDLAAAQQYAESGDPGVVATVSRLEEKLAREREALVARQTVIEVKPLIAAAKVTQKKNTKLLMREFESGRPVLSTTDTQAVLSVSNDFAIVRVLRVREMNYYRIDRAFTETLDAYIARVEAVDKGAVLHLMQRTDSKNVGHIVDANYERQLRSDVTMFARSGRFKSSTGFTFARGLESPNMWQNLMQDTGELISAERMSKGLEKIIVENSVVFRFTDRAIAEARDRAATGRAWADANGDIDAGKREDYFDGVDENDPEAVADAELRGALASVLESQGVEYQANQFVVLNLRSPGAKRPSERIQQGVLSVTDPEYLGELMRKQLSDRTIDPNAPGEYVLLPRSVYKGIQQSLRDESFRLRRPEDGWFGGPSWVSVWGLDAITRAWRTLTLNLLPRTAFVNMAGSSILALQGGASPYAMMLAFKAIHGIPHNGRILPVPPELRQRYYEQLFSDPKYASLDRETMLQEPSQLQGALAWGSYYMNSIRYLNGFSEDFGRLSIWYQQAYPEAIRAADGVRFFASARKLNNDAIDLLDAMASGNPAWAAKHALWMQKSFDFLGDLHKGGKTASYMRIAFPFYQWYKHMIKLQLLTMPAKYPGRALFFQMIGAIGEEYQREHGGNAPWGLDFVPIPGLDPVLDTTLGSPQEIYTGASSASIWPQYTWSQFATRDGDFQLYKAVQSTLNPEVTNAGLIALGVVSAIPGNDGVLEFNSSNPSNLSELFQPARDANGNVIDASLTPEFLGYMLNRLFRMVPLSPSIMSMGGQASNSIPGFQQEKEVKSLRGQYSNADQYKTDVSTIVSNLFNDPETALKYNIPLWIGRAFWGTGLQTQFGKGPVLDESMLNSINYIARKKSQEENEMRKRMEEIHSQIVQNLAN